VPGLRSLAPFPAALAPGARPPCPERRVQDAQPQIRTVRPP